MSVLTQQISRSETRLLLNRVALKPSERETMEACLLLTEDLWVGLVDDQFACVWGLIPPSLMSATAYLWMFHTQVVTDHEFVFVRHSQRMVAKMLEAYDSITGHCVAGQDQSIRWLKWLGAEFDKPNGKLVPFVIRKR